MQEKVRSDSYRSKVFVRASEIAIQRGHDLAARCCEQPHPVWLNAESRAGSAKELCRWGTKDEVFTGRVVV